LYCGDTLNTLGREDQYFHWSRAYNYYKALSLAKKKMNQIWTSGIALAGCVREVIDFRELVQWCFDKFNSEKIIIQLQGQQPISLAPSVFSRMLRLPSSTVQFKSEEANEFLKQHKGGKNYLSNYLVDPSNNPSVSKIEVSTLKYPYREFSWLFSSIIGLESTSCVPRNIIHVLHFYLHENAIID
jgi:hypothetical protein